MAKSKCEALRDFVWREEKFKEGLQLVKVYFGVENLFEDQVKALRCFFQGKNIYFSAPTGYGKSLIFQAIPLIADIMRDCLPSSSSTLVISPLQSLMLDQVTKLKKIGISAAAIYAGQSEEVLKDIEEGGIFSIILTSPESMLATDRWRRFLLSATFTSNCVCVAFDEAHCIAHWLVLPHSPRFFAVKFAEGKLGLNKMAVNCSRLLLFLFVLPM